MTASGDGEVLDVLVVGAGPTGLALSAMLLRYGARFRMVDRALDRVHESRALAIQPRTLEVLAGLGVTDQLVAQGNRTARLRLHAGRRTVSMPLFDIGLDDTAYPYLLFLSQAETERILVDHLAQHGVRPERGVELVGLEQHDDAVSCRLRSAGPEPDELVTARYVVGCDGAHSAVRTLAGIGFDGLAYPQTFVLADLEADGIEPGAAHAFVAGRGILFFFPLATPASWRLLAMRPPGRPEPAHGTVTLAELQALVDAATTSTVRLHDPLWATDFRIANRGATRYRSGRAFLAGDAAHIHSPAGAQGMNTGIQDAVNLGWKLGLVATGRGSPALLDTYEIERAPVGRRVLRFTDRAFTIGTSSNPLIRTARAPSSPTSRRWPHGSGGSAATDSASSPNSPSDTGTARCQPAVRTGSAVVRAPAIDSPTLPSHKTDCPPRSTPSSARPPSTCCCAAQRASGHRRPAPSSRTATQASSRSTVSAMTRPPTSSSTTPAGPSASSASEPPPPTCSSAPTATSPTSAAPTWRHSRCISAAGSRERDRRSHRSRRANAGSPEGEPALGCDAQTSQRFFCTNGSFSQ